VPRNLAHWLVEFGRVSHAMENCISGSHGGSSFCDRLSVMCLCVSSMMCVFNLCSSVLQNICSFTASVLGLTLAAGECINSILSNVDYEM